MATAGMPKRFLKNYYLSTHIYLNLLVQKKVPRKGSSTFIDKILLEACLAMFEQHRLLTGLMHRHLL